MTRGPCRGARSPVGQGRRGGRRRQTRAAAPAGLRARAGAGGRARDERKGPLERTKRRRGAHLFGLKAELIAVLLLRLKGYSILARRYAVSGGEIDLIARRGGSIAFVEVKARADLDDAASAISATKRRRIARAARVWLARNPWAAGLTLQGRRRLRRAPAPSPPRRRPRIGWKSTDPAAAIPSTMDPHAPDRRRADGPDRAHPHRRRFRRSRCFSKPRRAAIACSTTRPRG